MKALLIRCYPAVWRERYGDEFASILDERPLGPFDVADILLGALDARLRMPDRRAGLTERKGFNMSLRIGGIAAILAAVSLALAWFLGYGFVAVEDRFVWLLLVIGLGLLIVAIAGLTAFQGRAYPGASWAAFGLLTVGTIIATIGLVGAALEQDGFWNMGALGVLAALIGTFLFAIVTYQTAALSRAAAVLLGVGAILPFVSMASSLIILVVVAMVCFLLGWFLLGIQAIRRDRPAIDPRPA
jgi:hypothetical protein